MKFKKVSARLYTVLLPFTVLALLAVTIVSCYASISALRVQTEENMTANMDKNLNAIKEKMSSVEVATRDIANLVANTYKVADGMNTYHDVLGQMVQENELLVGVAVFLEPNLMGP